LQISIASSSVELALSVDRRIEVRVGQHHDGVLAAQFHRGVGQIMEKYC
jgi:hypothetical protein